MSDKTYDYLKTLSLLIAPIVVLVTALAQVWGIPEGEKIVATIAAVDVFLGAIVKISANRYQKNKGENDD